MDCVQTATGKKGTVSSSLARVHSTENSVTISANIPNAGRREAAQRSLVGETGRLCEIPASYPCDPVMRETASLFPHPLISKLQLEPRAEHILKLEAIGASLFDRPLFITREGIIVDGHARWMAAKKLGREKVPCLEFDLSPEDALERILSEVPKPSWLVPFARVELALSLGRKLQEQGRLNQQRGGQHKGLSKLAEAERINTRREVARIARVSTGNVTKVRQILSAAMDSEVINAVRSSEISIHFAWKLRACSRNEQLDAISVRRFRQKARKKLVRLARAKLSFDASVRESLRLIASGLRMLPATPAMKEMLDPLNACLSYLDAHRDALEGGSHEQPVLHQADPERWAGVLG